MPIIHDVRTAVRLAERLLKSRRSRRALARRLPTAPAPAPGTIEIAVYFADGPVNMYQVRQWYAPLAELAATHPVAIISRSPGTMLTLLEEAPVPVVYARQVVDLERFVDEQAPKIVLYVNQNARNFQMMRYGRMWHVFVNHGESDKMYMTSNQHKAYDYAFVAGDAARARLQRALWDYDVDTRTIEIGRPQTDHLAGDPPYTPDDRTVVLYSPTWEGDRPAACYGSVATHGENLVRALIATGRHRVVYRPHPRSGVVDSEFGDANSRIIEMLEEANKADRSAQHVYDDSPTLGWQLLLPDVAICDISAMVYDRLATGKPLMVTRPVAPEASVDEGGYLSVCEWLDTADTDGIAAVLDRVIGDSEAKQRLGVWSQRYFGDTTPGAPTARFHEAIGALLEKADAERAKASARA